MNKQSKEFKVIYHAIGRNCGRLAIQMHEILLEAIKASATKITIEIVPHSEQKIEQRNTFQDYIKELELTAKKN